MKSRPFDISVVLNVHDEAKFLARTVQSVREAIRFARCCGLSVEFVIVLDKPDLRTRSWVKRLEFQDADAFQTIEVDHGSLGLARNSGAQSAHGEYIALADADDLISYNWLVEMYAAASSTQDGTVIAVPAFLFAFGEKRYICEYFESDVVGALPFVQYHPYVSRITAHSSLFQRLAYADLSASSGFAFEDWQFNSEAIAHGYRFVPALNAVLFYRQRANSLAWRAKSTSANIPDWNTLLQPEVFLRLCSEQMIGLLQGRINSEEAELSRTRLAENYVIREVAAAASYIDPAIDPFAMGDLPYCSNLSDDLRLASAYYRLCTFLEGKAYTDIVLMPFLSKGGGEKYIADFLASVEVIDPGRSYLFLLGESIGAHHWLDRLPPRSDVIDLFEISRGLLPGSIELLTLRAVQYCGSDCRIYLKNCGYVDSFFRRYGRFLRNQDISYFRFSDPMMPISGRFAFRGFSFDFLSELGDRITRVITDNKSIARHDCERLDFLREKYRVLYPRCAVRDDARVRSTAGHSRAVLWASRLDPEKRPGLLIKIASKLHQIDPTISIDVYGTSMSSDFDVRTFLGQPNICYRGPFSDFGEIPTDRYDAFLYTSAYDGLPNVALEAMAQGLPVVAANVGGISEVVTTETGILLENVVDEGDLSESFARSVKSLYTGVVDLAQLSANALSLIRRQHSPAAHIDSVARFVRNN